jgi:hypothetical protein
MSLKIKKEEKRRGELKTCGLVWQIGHNQSNSRTGSTQHLYRIYRIENIRNRARGFETS